MSIKYKELLLYKQHPTDGGAGVHHGPGSQGVPPPKQAAEENVKKSRVHEEVTIVKQT